MTDVPEPQREITARPDDGKKPSLDDGSWTERLSDWAYQLSVLKVVTYVGKAVVTPDDDGLPKSITLTADGDPFVTVCNLIGGDISNVIPTKYKDDEGLREFHAGQVEKAGQILPNNLKIIGDLVKSVF